MRKLISCQIQELEPEITHENWDGGVYPYHVAACKSFFAYRHEKAATPLLHPISRCHNLFWY